MLAVNLSLNWDKKTGWIYHHYSLALLLQSQLSSLLLAPCLLICNDAPPTTGWLRPLGYNNMIAPPPTHPSPWSPPWSSAPLAAPPPPPPRLLPPPPGRSHDGGTIDPRTSWIRRPSSCWNIIVYIFIYWGSVRPPLAMTRWVPTKKEKYGVGKCFSWLFYSRRKAEKVGKFCWDMSRTKQFPNFHFQTFGGFFVLFLRLFCGVRNEFSPQRL